MQKRLFSILLLISMLLLSQNLLANDTLVSNKDVSIEVVNLKKGNLSKEVDDRLGRRSIDNVKNLLVKSGDLNNEDIEFLANDLKNIEVIDLEFANFDNNEMRASFSKHKNIKKISLPKSKEGYKLANDFFKDNKSLEEIDLNGVNHLGASVFENTKSLYNIDLSKVEKLEKAAFNKSNIKNVIFKDNFDLPNEFFKNTKSLANIDISQAETIGKGVFENSSVEYIKMPKSYALESRTFAKTKNLKEIDLSGATRLGKADFLESAIEKVIFPKSYVLADLYFAKTNNLETIDISNAKEIKKGVFAFSNIKKVSFPKDYEVSEGLFQYSQNLKEIDVSNAKKFNDAAFAGASLEKIILPSSFEVSNAMFGFMENLVSIDLSGAEFLSSNIFVKKGSNYDFYRKLFDDNDLKSNIKKGIEVVIFANSVPSVSEDSFANLNNQAPIVLFPKSKEWDSFAKNISSKKNEIKQTLRFEAYTYEDLMISKNSSVQIGFINTTFKDAKDKKSDVTYQWYFNDKKITNANQSTFTIDNFSISDEGSYRLEISIGSKVYHLNPILLEANELVVDDATLYNGYFLNEKVNEEDVRVLYVKDDIKREIDSEFLQFDYDFSEIGNKSIKISYIEDDFDVVADYPVKVANNLSQNIKIKKGDSFTYNPKIDGFEFVSLAKQKEFFEIKEDEKSNEVTIYAKEKYEGKLDYKFNSRVGQVSIEIVNNLFWLWISLSILLLIIVAIVIYLRVTRGMFKIKKKNK